MLAAVQEAVLQVALEIRCKPHLHPYIHSTEFISTAERVVRGEGEEWRERDGGGTEESTVALGIYKKKKRDMIPFAIRMWKQAGFYSPP